MKEGINKIELLKYTFFRHFKILTLFLLVIMGLMSKCTDNRLELNKQGYFEKSSRECIIKYAAQEGENNDRYILGLESEVHCFELDEKYISHYLTLVLKDMTLYMSAFL